MTDTAELIRRLQYPPFGTETSERNLMAAAAEALKDERAKREAAEAKLAEAANVFASIANCPKQSKLDWYEMVEWMCGAARATLAKIGGEG